MEVHHHAHHGGKKNWKAYIWEFLMLFLAVFCGFLAEWQLERVIEHHREEEYIQSMIEDIQADIQQADQLVPGISDRIALVDSLLLTLASEDVQSNSNNAYKLWLRTIGFPDFVPNDRTIQQLKSSGALRLIRKKAVSDKIMEYDQAVRLLAVTQNNMNSIASNTSLFNRTFDFIQLTRQDRQPVPFTEEGKKLLNEAYASRFFWKTNLSGLRQRLLLLKEKGKEVKDFIANQYHLEMRTVPE